jgi:predicted nucleic acid-binding protein
MPDFDASSMIYAWDNYPEKQFPGLWEWIEVRIQGKDICMSIVAFEEVKLKAPDCATWLAQREIEQRIITNDIAQDANRIKGLLGIVGDNYHPKGVDENDLLIIATARAHGIQLISEEHQPLPPNEPRRCKIPTVCRMTGVAHPCTNFIEYIKTVGAVFR